MTMNKRMLLSIFWIVLGAGLVISYFFTKENNYFFSLGIAFVVVGVMQLYQNVKYRTDEEYREKVIISSKDERIKFLSNKAWAWTGFISVMAGAGISIVAMLLNKDGLATVLGLGICFMMITYSVVFMILQKKY